MPTKTTPAPTTESLAQDLDAAIAARDELRERLKAGGPVTPSTLAEAEQAVTWAELRLELAEESAAEALESRRLDEIEEILAGLRDARGPALLAAEVVRLHAEAAEAAGRLAAVAEQLVEEVQATHRRLQRLQPLPANVQTNGSGSAGPRSDRLVVDGVRWPHQFDVPLRLVADAAYRGLRSAPRAASLSGTRSLRDVAGSSAAIDVVRRCAPTEDSADAP
jgi:hypothetical protein